MQIFCNIYLIPIPSTQLTLTYVSVMTDKTPININTFLDCMTFIPKEISVVNPSMNKSHSNLLKSDIPYTPYDNMAKIKGLSSYQSTSPLKVSMSF